MFSSAITVTGIKLTTADANDAVDEFVLYGDLNPSTSAGPAITAATCGQSAAAAGHTYFSFNAAEKTCEHSADCATPVAAAGWAVYADGLPDQPPTALDIEIANTEAQGNTEHHLSAEHLAQEESLATVGASLGVVNGESTALGAVTQLLNEVREEQPRSGAACGRSRQLP